MLELRHVAKRRPVRLMLMVVLVAALSACSGDDDDSASDTTAAAAPAATTAAAGATAAPAEGATVTIANNAFDPAAASVAAAQALVFTNTDATAHQIASETSDLLVSDPLDQGSQFTVTFDTPGTYDYFCAIHPEMTGTIEVTA